MTAEDFKNIVEAKGQFPKTDFDLKAVWQRVCDEIMPHYTGIMPRSLDAAFPNEDDRVRDYRKNNYVPITKALIQKAIKGMYRLFSKSNYSIDFENNNMREYITKNRFGSQSYTVEDYFFRVLYPHRVIDPNAVVLVEPHGSGLYAANIQVAAKLKVIPSSQIEYKSNELLIYKPKNEQRTVTIDGIETTYNVQYYYHNIDGFSFLGTESGTTKEAEIVIVYEHRLDRPTWFTLGGRYNIMTKNGKTYEYYESDFSSAVPFMDRATIYENMSFGVAVNQGYPIKVAMTQPCHECDGDTTVMNDDGDEIRCPVCYGRGEIPLGASPNEVVTMQVKGREAADKAKYATIQPVYFVSPDTATVQSLDKRQDEWYQKTKDILNIDKLVKQAQSGVAKELDREESAIEIDEIAEQFYQLLEEVLTVIQSLVFLDATSKITVNQPIDFRRKTEDELLADFKTTMQDGTPYDVRLKAFKAYLQRRYSNDKIGLQIAETVAEYAPLYLFTLDEQNRMFNIDNFEKVKAIYAYSVLSMLHAKDSTVFENKDRLFARMDEIIKAKLPTITSTININESRITTGAEENSE